MIISLIFMSPLIIIFLFKSLIQLLLNVYNKINNMFTKKELKKSALRKKMDEAKTYEEWRVAAEEYDSLDGIEEWKKREKSSDYDWKYVKKLTQQLQEARRANNYQRVISLVRAHSYRNFANTLNPVLYHRSYIGTKHLIEDFQKEFVICLEYIANLPHTLISLTRKVEIFSELRQVFGRAALVLSGGASVGIYHFGVLRALFEYGLLPKIVSGTSAGSMLAAIVCTKTLDEIKELFAHPADGIKLGAFERAEYKFTFFQKLNRLYRLKLLYNPDVIKEFIRDNCGDITFQEAYDRTGQILNITVTGHGIHDGNMVLNYLTTPDVVIWSAVCASAALPYIFGPIQLFCKDEKGNIVPYIDSSRRFVDGSLGTDLPLQTLSEMFNVNCFIVSQTEPWVIPFLTSSEFDRQLQSKPWKYLYELIKKTVLSDIKQTIIQLLSLGILPRFMARYLSMIGQKYRGDVTIWPKLRLKDLVALLGYPSRERLEFAYYEGARRTYPKMNYIAALLLIGKTIEKNFFLLEYKQLATTVSRATSLQSLEKLDVEQQAIVEESSSSSISEEEISKEKEEAEEEKEEKREEKVVKGEKEEIKSPELKPRRRSSLYPKGVRKKLTEYDLHHRYSTLELYDKMKNTHYRAPHGVPSLEMLNGLGTVLNLDKLKENDFVQKDVRVG